MKHKRLFTIIPSTAVLLFGAMLLTGCGSSGESSATKTDAAATAQTTAPAQAAQTTPAVTYPGMATTTPVVKTEDGLGYIDMVTGTGASPQAGDKVHVHYTGYFTDGRKLDSSVDRGKPFTFTLAAGQVIKGWDEGVATMKVGGKRKLIIPASLAWGDRGFGDRVPPGTDVIFDVELLGMN